MICSRLAGKEKCECSWCGLCIYNEFMQNDGIVRNIRKSVKAPVVYRKKYASDLLVMSVEVDKNMALNAVEPGSFVFLNGGREEFFSVPVSVMKADVQEERLTFAIKVISAKTEAVAGAEDFVLVRGIYRNGLLGAGVFGDNTPEGADGKTLIIAKGIGLAPAVNLLSRCCKKTAVDMIIDTEKITPEFVSDSLRLCESAGDNLSVTIASLAEADENGGGLRIGEKIFSSEDYSGVVILASDYYIVKMARCLGVPSDKLTFSNNFHMCCGEGICGACSHIDKEGNTSKMCKCRQVDVKNLL